MRKKLALFCSICLGVMLTGCGVTTTPEIIMPDEPLTSSVSEVNTSNTSTSSTKEAADTEKTETKADSGNSYKVYLITMDMTDSYWQSIDKGCQKAVQEIGNITYKWIGPDTHDDALQSACIDQAVADGANAILIAANSADGVNDSLQAAAESGCKIVYVDCAASFECVTALATDNEKAGETAAETMKEALKAEGVESGTIGILGVTPDTASCVSRETGFREAFEGTDYTLADTVYMEDSADNVKVAVTEGIGNGYVGFFGTNEGTTSAIGNTLKESGEQSIVVGFDTSDAVLSMVSEGIIYATMQQKPETMGHDGLKIAIQALEGEYTDTNTKTDTGVNVITKGTM